MKDIIINQPHLQTFSQRLVSACLKLVSWLLWLYFLLPLLTLGGWLLGFKNLTNEIRWFGGYKTLLELLAIYGLIILVIAVFWVFWTLFLTWLNRYQVMKSVPVVTDTQLAATFHVDLQQLNQSRTHQLVTVHFDDHAVITGLE